MYASLLNKECITNYFITRVRITCFFGTGSSIRTKTIGFGDTTCYHYIKPIFCGASRNRTAIIPASTGRNRTISAKAPCSLYEDRTHPPGSKDQCPNQLGEQTIFADDERFESRLYRDRLFDPALNRGTLYH